MEKELEVFIHKEHEKYNKTHCFSLTDIEKLANEQYELNKHHGIELRTWMIAFDVANKVLKIE